MNNKKKIEVRMFSFMLLTVIATILVVYLAPQQLPVTIYKLSLITLAGVLGYRLDRALFPYARPHDIWEIFQDESKDSRTVPSWAWIYCASMIRRAVIVFGVIVGVALGL